MSLRPVPARWFQVLVPRTDTARVTGALARTGAVEVEVADRSQVATEFGELAAGLQRYREHLAEYAPYWARGQLRHSATMATPQETLAQALAAIENWRDQTDEMIARLQASEEEWARLRLWERVLSCGEDRIVDFRLLARAGPLLGALVAALPPEVPPPEDDTSLCLCLPLGEEQCLLAVGPAAAVRELRQRVHGLKGRVLERPDWMVGTAREVAALTATRALRLDLEVRRLYAEIDALHEDCGLPEALADLTCLEWFAANVGPLPATEHLAWVTGWTDDPDGRRLTTALEREGVRGLFRFADPPEGTRPPQLMRNPPWVRPFELFALALGTPGAGEADPSPWLAVVVPLLFGYMFGDVGQGLVILVAGWWLRDRGPFAPLLMVAGLSATFFGVLFGSVFAYEDVLPALWFSPMHQPLLALGLPLGFGVVLLTLSQALNALEHAWRGEMRHWWTHEAGLLVAYLGVVLGLLHSSLLLLVPIGLIGHLVGYLWAGRSIGAFLKALATLIEDGQRLLVNTVSFARVGAFALAHGGLSLAVVTLAESGDSPVLTFLVMVVGNLIIIALEGLVVAIQTTRLVLFEFFLRFLRGEGRPFRPLPAPPDVLEGGTYEISR
jgi:V/A-type H+-transporting ATPase subunit I